MRQRLGNELGVKPVLDHTAFVLSAALERRLVDFGLPDGRRHLDESGAECRCKCKDRARVVHIFVDELVVLAHKVALERLLRHQRRFGEGIVDVIKDQRQFRDWLAIVN